MCSRLLALSLVVVAVVGLAVGAVTAPGQDGTAPRTAGAEYSVRGPAATTAADAPGNDSDDPRPGARLAGAVAVGGAEAGSDVGAAAFAAALDGARSDDERARIVRERLDTVAGRLDTLEGRVRALERARANGSLSPGGFRARGADLAAQLRAVQGVLDRAETAAATLTADRGRRLEDRVAELRSRTREMLDADLRAAARTIDGADVEGDASPVALEDAVAAYERSGGRAPGLWVALFGSERIALHVERANGKTAVFGLHTSGGDVVESTRAPPDNPTLRVETNYRVVRGVATGENPWDVASRSLAEDRITYRGVGIVGTLKYGLIAVVLFVFDGLRALLFGALDLLAGLADFLGRLV